MPDHRTPPPDFGEVYNRVAERYTGDVDRDLSEAGLPPDLVVAVSEVAAKWATAKSPPLYAAALAFHVGAMTGAEWARGCRTNA